jgi:stage V sporulation protein D (sporulation-specific penicillin-binding protein)
MREQEAAADVDRRRANESRADGKTARTDMAALSRRRMLAVFGVITALFALLALRIGWITVITSESYTVEAAGQQTRDVILPAKRGSVYDRNMIELVASASSYRVWVRPAIVAPANLSDEEQDRRADAVARILSETIGLDPEKAREMIGREQNLVRVAKDVDKAAADALRTRARAEGFSAGVEIADSVSRFYPYGPFAAHVIGSVNDDGRGVGGVELEYDHYLSGVAGRWIKDADPSGNILAYGSETRHGAQNGLSLVLTIDEAIQLYVEKTLEKVQADTDAKRVMAIVMDPKTGDILAMGMTPDYDPGNPRTPLDPVEAAYVQALPQDEQLAYWNAMWRNPMISDTYEPGSTFKLLTVAAALEERVASPEDIFTCEGRYQVASNWLRCWRFNQPHGKQTVTQAVGNSCNPVMIQLVQRMGYDTFYRYLEMFGIAEKTGVDYPGESAAQLQSREVAGPVGLATMSFGQGISITPMQLITAVSAIGNEGKLMRPRLVRGLADDTGSIVEHFDAKVVRQVVSRQTAEEVKGIMEFVVEESGGTAAQIPGYRIGGKTGTAEKLDNGSYKTGKVVASMIAMAPMEDPQVCVLLIVDEPQGEKYGSTTAAPGVRDILTEVLRRLDIAPSYTQEELAQMQQSYVIVPDMTGMNYSDAAGKLLSLGLAYISSPATGETDFIVTDQYPKAGEKLAAESQVCLYSE